MDCLARSPELARAHAWIFSSRIVWLTSSSLIDSKAVFVCRRPASDFAEYSLEFPLATPSRPLLEMLLCHEGGELLRNRCADKLVDRDSFSASHFLISSCSELGSLRLSVLI